MKKSTALVLALVSLVACGQPPAPPAPAAPAAVAPAAEPAAAPAAAPAPAAGGALFDAMDAVTGWEKYNGDGSSINLASVPGETGNALEISYTMGTGAWVAMWKAAGRDLTAYKGVRFRIKGEGSANTIEFKLEDKDGSNFVVFAPFKSNAASWTTVDIPLSSLKYGWGGDQNLALSDIKVHFAISAQEGDQKGSGKLLIDQVEFY